MLDRRAFSMVAGASLVGMVTGKAAWARSAATVSNGWRPGGEDRWFTWERVGENAWAGIGEGGNSLVVAGAGEMLLVDTKNAGFGDTLRREASELAADARLARVINTHHHADHTGGNYAFAPGIPIVAHEKAIMRVREQVDRYKDRIKGVPGQVAKSEKAGAKKVMEEAEKVAAAAVSFGPDRFVPTEAAVLDGEQRWAGRRVELRHFGAGHTDNDVVVRLPELNLIHTGDLLFMGRHPVMDVRAGATSAGWLRSLARLIEMCDEKTVVVPGHGGVTDVGGLRTQVRYFETVREQVCVAIERGRTRDEVQSMPIEEYKEYGSPQGRNGVLTAVFDELKGAAK